MDNLKINTFILFWKLLYNFLLELRSEHNKTEFTFDLINSELMEGDI